MKRVNFYYSTKLTFDDYVHGHSFALRIIPPETDTQRILSCDLNITPYVSVKQTVDAFGNNVTAGYLKSDHRFLDFEIKGTAEVDSSKHRTDYMPCYLYQSQYTKPGEKLAAFYSEIKPKCTGTVQDRTEYICDILSDRFGYEKGFTDTSTTAEEAFASGKGVCQDFSHILISLLRMDGIAARYIAGLAFCDGETHSWVLDGRSLGGHRPRQQLRCQRRLYRAFPGQRFPRLRYRQGHNVRAVHKAATACKERIIIGKGQDKMTETIATAALAVHENLNIQKRRIQNGKSKTRLSFVTGTHGDELEGQYLAYMVGSFIDKNIDKLEGIVDIYPALNPMGIDSITRGIPMFDLDMNRVFPGSKSGTMAEMLCAAIVDDIKGSDVCVDVHSSNIFLKEIPQIRMSVPTAETLLPYAKLMNVDFIWIHDAATVLESTLAHTLNTRGTKTLVVEMGVGMRITKEYCDQLFDGVFSLMKSLGMWKGETAPVREPIVSEGREVGFVNSDAAGIFVPCANFGDTVRKGDHIGDVVDPLSSETVEQVKAVCDGLIFTLREYPVVYGGSLLARILQPISGGEGK